MKKLISLMLVSMVLLIASTTNAQPGRASTMPLAAGDTCTDAGVVTKVLPVLTAGYEGAVVFANVRKLSGTVGGTVGLYGSLDGTTYVQIGSNQTVTNTTGTKGYSFYVTGPVPVYLEVIHTGTGTMSSVLTIQYVYRKHQ